MNIFKAIVLVAEQADGSVAAVAARSSEPVMEAARALRDTGSALLGDIAIQAPVGARGAVLANFRAVPLMKFKVGGEVEAQANPAEVETPPAAVKARPRKG
jgi:hypothetical protein